MVLAATMALMMVVAAAPTLAQLDGFFDGGPGLGDISCDNDSCDNGVFFDGGTAINHNGESQSGVVSTSHQLSDSDN